MKLSHICYLNKNVNLSLTDQMRNSGVTSAMSLILQQINIKSKLKEGKKKRLLFLKNTI